MSGSRFQSDVDRLIQEGKQKQQEIEKQTAFIVGQQKNNIQELIEQQQKKQQQIEQQTASIVGKQQNDIQKLIEQQQEIQYQKQQNYTEEEKIYVNSPFYQNYKGILNNIDSVVAQTKAKITEIYQKNVQFYNNPYYKEISDSVVISGIGFPVPERFLNNLKQLIEIKMEDVSLEDGYVDVEIIPSEYMRQGNTVVKKTNAYQVKTTLKNIKTKTK